LIAPKMLGAVKADRLIANLDSGNRKRGEVFFSQQVQGSLRRVVVEACRKAYKQLEQIVVGQQLLLFFVELGPTAGGETNKTSGARGKGGVLLLADSGRAKRPRCIRAHSCHFQLNDKIKNKETIVPGGPDCYSLPSDHIVPPPVRAYWLRRTARFAHARPHTFRNEMLLSDTPPRPQGERLGAAPLTATGGARKKTEQNQKPGNS